jgi:pimeloyl-ACP methyl ester carboxylesterase
MPEPEIANRPVRFSAGGRQLAGMLHLPEGACREPGVVFCNAFGDERRSSALTMARLARSVAGRGFPVLRFDYWGCGDSPGEFADATVQTQLEDIRSAVGFLREETSAKSVCLLGLRFGATLAVRAADDEPACAALVLVQPVPDGAAYVDAEVKRKLVRGMITKALGGIASAAPEDEVIDLDGYALRRKTVEQMRALRIEPGGNAARCKTVIIQVSFNEKLRPESEAARAAFQACGATADIVTLVMPPFWSRHDAMPTTVLEEAVCGWLERAVGAIQAPDR